YSSAASDVYKRQVYIISIITMIAEDFACSGNGSMIFLICYFSTFSMLMLAPTDSSKQ
ncbi:hypothetical protein N3K60_12765, partial [Escherichia coli]|nr:hypothetical protein [Escherichia coli]